MPIPLRAFSSTPHRRTGGPVDQMRERKRTACAAELHIALMRRGLEAGFATLLIAWTRES
ncbi:hypothetical protein DyAD56_09070 [Dyella sp. AD56]|nr:hypothetical protein DyAD56_09070 [Dyella sp. AD56]